MGIFFLVGCLKYVCDIGIVYVYLCCVWVLFIAILASILFALDE